MLFRNLLFSAIIIATIFGAAELLLAAAGIQPLIRTQDPLVGFSGNIPQFVKATRRDGTEMFITPRNKLDYFNFQEFPRQKGDNAYRIFCVGGSTTYGRPYSHKVSFCGWMQAYLEAADPSRKWEVINAGGITYASYRVARMMNELVDYEPDLFIVYTGQNEFLEERSYGKLKELPPWMIELDAALSATRIYSAMKLAIDAVRPQQSEISLQQDELLPEEVDDIMSHTAGPETYRRDEKLRQTIITHYRINLERIADIARSAGADSIFVMPAKKLRDLKPFKSEHRNDLEPDELMQWLALYNDARQRRQSGDLVGALAGFRDAAAIDDRYAELHYRIAEILFEQKQYDMAESEFRRAVEEDVTPLRIPAAMQRIVAEVANENDAPLIDFPALLRKEYRQQYGHTIFGSEYFLDHVHATIEGYRLVGEALFDELIAQGIAQPDNEWNAARADQVREQVLAGIDETDFGSSCLALGVIFAWSAMYEEAEEMLLRALDVLGPNVVTYMRLASTYRGMGDLDAAYAYLVKTTELDPDLPWLHSRLAIILLEQQKPEEALAECRKEMELAPETPGALYCSAKAYAALGDSVKAQEYFERALESGARSPYIHKGYAVFLIEQQRSGEAFIQAQTAVELNPADAEAHNMLGNLLLDRGERDDAWQHIAEALRLKPDYEPALENLRRMQQGS